MQNVPPEYCSGLSFRSLASAASSRASTLIWKIVLRCASRITGVMSPSSMATANETWAAE